MTSRWLAPIAVAALLMFGGTIAVLEYRFSGLLETMGQLQARIARMERRDALDQQATERLLTGLESRIDALAHRVRDCERPDLMRPTP